MVSLRLFLLLGFLIACGVEARGVGKDSANECKGFGCTLNYNDLRRTFEGRPSSAFLDDVLQSLNVHNPIQQEWADLRRQLLDADAATDSFKVTKESLQSNETGSFNSSDKTSGTWNSKGAQQRFADDRNVNITKAQFAEIKMADNRTFFYVSFTNMSVHCESDSHVQFFVIRWNLFANESGGEFLELANSTMISFGDLSFPDKNQTFAYVNQTSFEVTNITNQITLSQSNTTGTLSFNDEHGQFNGTTWGAAQRNTTNLPGGTENMSKDAILLRKLLQLPLNSSKTPTKWTTKYAGEWTKKEVYKFYNNANTTVHAEPETTSSAIASGFVWKVDGSSNEPGHGTFIRNILMNILQTLL